MRKKIFYFALCAMLFAPCLSAEAQQQGKVVKIGWLARAASATRLDLFRRELGQLGYVEGKNMAIED